MAENRQYDHEYKVQAVKLAKEIGQAKAVKELGISKNTMYGWVRANRLGCLDLEAGSQTPQSAMCLCLDRNPLSYRPADNATCIGCGQRNNLNTPSCALPGIRGSRPYQL